MGEFLSIVIGILAFIFVLGTIIIFHEGGHFLFARRADILCREFAFGMGPQLIKKKKGETVYSIRAFPIGGFCAIAGEEVEDDPFKNVSEIGLDVQGGVIKGFYFDDTNPKDVVIPRYKIIEYDIYDEANSGNLYMKVEKDDVITTFAVDAKAMLYAKRQEVQIAPYNRTIGSKKLGPRTLVIFGGPLMNFILALLVFIIVGLCTKFPNYDTSKIETYEDTIAYIGGLETNDVITKMQYGTITKDVINWNDYQSFMRDYKMNNDGESITITYLRDGTIHTTSLIPQTILNTIAIASDYTKTDKVVIGDITSVEEKEIYNSNLKIGDEIISIDGQSISSWGDVSRLFEENIEGKEMNFTIKRDVDGIITTISNVKVKPYSKEYYQIAIKSNSIIFSSSSSKEVDYTKTVLGVNPIYEYSFGEGIKYGFIQTWNSFKIIFVTLRSLFTSSAVGVGDLSGPIGIFALTKMIASQGFLYLLNLMGMLSVNVGLLNLLPIPALDGGRLVFLGYEAITKKKPNPKVETILISVTMILLFILMGVVALNDVFKFIIK